MKRTLMMATCVGCLLNAQVGATGKQPDAHPKERVVMGWLESVFIKPWNRRVTAKLDTGAKISSLHADKLEHFTRNGDPWVRFSLVDIEERKQSPVLVEKALVRTAYIKSHQRQPSKRDVVMMTVCKNGRDYEAEFNLVDRSNFNYPVLLGRSLLKELALVDADATFLFKAEDDPCTVPQGSGKRF
jgi:hypothetical protein